VAGHRCQGQEEAGWEEEEGEEEKEEGRQAIGWSWSSPPSAPGMIAAAAACRRRRHGKATRLCAKDVVVLWCVRTELKDPSPSSDDHDTRQL